jgi:hypothetical protein
VQIGEDANFFNISKKKRLMNELDNPWPIQKVSDDHVNEMKI